MPMWHPSQSERRHRTVLKSIKQIVFSPIQGAFKISKGVCPTVAYGVISLQPSPCNIWTVALKSCHSAQQKMTPLRENRFLNYPDC